MIEVILNDRLGKKVRVKCNEDDTVGDLKKLVAAQTGTRPDKIRIQKWQQPGQFQLPSQFATPEQRYQAILQQQSASQRSVPVLSSLVHALGGHLPGRVAQPVGTPQQAFSSQPAQSIALQPQPAAQSQPARSDQQQVLTRFSGPASTSFQAHALAPRTSLQQPAQAPLASTSTTIQHVALSAEPVRSAAAPSTATSPILSAVPGPSVAAAGPNSVPAAIAPAAPKPGPNPGADRQHVEPAVAADDGFDEVPQVLKAPPPGKVVWAKLARYPWWPAEVLNMSDPYIPDGEEPPRLGAVPVRFFGTYAFSWIESKRAIEPFDDEHVEHAANSRQPQFQRGVSEAKHFQLTGELPHGFTVALQQFYEEQQKAISKSAAKGAKGSDDVKNMTGKGGKKGSPFAAANPACLIGFGPVAAQLGYVQPAAAQ
ncbi:hypothetical protein WJX77_004317 [Trebouxia sp. C0004]